MPAGAGPSLFDLIIDIASSFGFGTEGNFPIWIPPVWLIDISLGDGWFDDSGGQFSLPGVPPMGQPTTPGEAPAFPIEVDLRDEPTTQQGGVMQVAVDWFDYWANEGLRLPPIETVGVAAPAQLVEGSGDDMGWFEDLYDVVDESLGGVLPGGVPLGGSVALPLTSPSPGGLPATYPTVTQLPGTAPVVSSGRMCFKMVNGVWKWVPTRRRRRKRLATPSDIKDLAALKGVLGPKNLATWIATHS